MKGEKAGRTEFFCEGLPFGPCAGLMDLLNMFSVVNKPQRGGGRLWLNQSW
jgi:hypothetical protein